MSTTKTSLENFERLLDQALVLEKAARSFQELLFGPQGESRGQSEQPAETLSPSGFFPVVFSKQTQIEQVLSRAAAVMAEVNKTLGIQEIPNKRPFLGKSMPPATPFKDTTDGASSDA